MAIESISKRRNKSEDEVFEEATAQVNYAFRTGSRSLRLGRGRRNLKRLPDLSKLGNLRTLNLSGTGISDIGGLAELKSLEELTLSFTEVSELNVLSKLTSLRKLSIGGSAIRSLEAIRSLQNLRELAIDGHSIRDVEPLSSLPKLETLYFPYGKPISWSPIALSTSLRELSVFSGRSDDWNWLADLPNVSILFLSSSNIIELPNMRGLTKLKSLDISNTAVVDLNPIRQALHLKTLNISRTPISSLSPVSNLMLLEDLDLDGSKISDLSPVANIENLMRGAQRARYLGLSFSECPLQDEKLLSFSHLENPKRTVETFQYLRSLLDLPPVAESANELDASAEPSEDIPSISAIPSAEIRALQFKSGERGPIELQPLSSPDESLFDGIGRQEDYAELRFKAEALRQLGTNRLGSLSSPVERLLALPEEVSQVRAALFWSRMNTLRMRFNAHVAATSNAGDGHDDRSLEPAAAAILSDLVETLNIFVLGDPILIDLDAARPGPQDIATAMEELNLVSEVLQEAVDDPDIASDATKEALGEQIENLKASDGSLAGRQAAEFGKRSVRNFIGEILRRAYAPIRGAIKLSKSEAALAAKGVREGAYRAAGAGLLTGTATDILGVSNFSGRFVQFVADHGSVLSQYVQSAFQNPSIQRIIELVTNALS